MHLHNITGKAIQLCCCHLWLLMGILLTLNNDAQAEALQVRVATPEAIEITDIRHYYEQLLTLALEKTRKTDGDFTLIHNNSTSGPERERAMLVADVGLDVTWGTATNEREKTLHPVKFDLVKNLNSYRTLIIQKGNQITFDHIKTLSEFRTLTAGSGINWSTSTILADNDIKTITSGSFTGLYKMLAAARFDYVARAPYEINLEVSEFGIYGIEAENSLLLKLSKPSPYVFFVKKNNLKLAERIERGLQLAQADGSFDALFLSYPNLKSAMELIHKSNRTVLELNNKIN